VARPTHDMGFLPYAIYCRASGLGDEPERLLLSWRCGLRSAWATAIDLSAGANGSDSGCSGLDRAHQYCATFDVALCLLYLLWRRLAVRSNSQEGLVPSHCRIVVSPWLLRNYRASGFVLCATTFPSKCTCQTTTSQLDYGHAASIRNDPEAMREFQQLGELGFMKRNNASSPVRA